MLFAVSGKWVLCRSGRLQAVERPIWPHFCSDGSAGWSAAVPRGWSHIHVYRTIGVLIYKLNISVFPLQLRTTAPAKLPLDSNVKFANHMAAAECIYGCRTWKMYRHSILRFIKESDQWSRVCCKCQCMTPLNSFCFSQIIIFLSPSISGVVSWR